MLKIRSKCLLITFWCILMLYSNTYVPCLVCCSLNWQKEKYWYFQYNQLQRHHLQWQAPRQWSRQSLQAMDHLTVSSPPTSVGGHRVPRMTLTGDGTEALLSPQAQDLPVTIQEVSRVFHTYKLIAYSGNSTLQKFPKWCQNFSKEIE